MVIIQHSFPIMVARTTIANIYIYIYIIGIEVSCICCYVLFTKIKKEYR